ncbi:hypothetical protein X808_9780 [Mannheimia varigena USDA-ARS-USMARC-1296]|uniref:Uncharacterized protein n=1 Tax=Mannheimia varigena USDA-ARS-USMARC-1296 TaxID=1433287 RepID=W0QAC3_9PAST|nr:hypothetical protein X808_9780 [Mannheimia varigena USDA-ARS-USMARC-1296]
MKPCVFYLMYPERSRCKVHFLDKRFDLYNFLQKEQKINRL